MKNFIKQAENKAIRASMMLRNKASEVGERAKGILTNNEGQGTLDVAVTVLISYVPEIYNDGGVIPKERNSSFCFFVTSPMTFPT